jgi:putative flippase GtrA
MKIIKYFIVGSIAALTDISLFYIFAKLLAYNYLIVAFFSYTIATFVNYILSINYVFQSGIKFSKKQELSLIYLVSGIAIMINQISLYILVDLLSIEIITSKVIAIVITFFWNYFTRNNFIFLFRERIKY